jgi:hypothetical protein
MSNPIKKREWWEREGIRFLGGESGSHVPTHKDFGLFGYDSGYAQGFEDFRKIAVEFLSTMIQGDPKVPTEPTEDE